MAEILQTPLISQLTEADAEAFRALRLAALAGHPDAYNDAWQDEANQPLPWFADRLAHNTVFGARRSATGIVEGVVGLWYPRQEKRRHKAVLWGMYVRPEARAGGLASALLTHAITHAHGKVEAVTLAAVADNDAAIRLYEKAGFEPYALERRALCIGERYHDELLMEKWLQ